MITTVTKEMNFCAAHRLVGYNGPCKNIHGHNYKVFLTLERTLDSQGDSGLDKLGMVIDFKAIKEHIQNWLDEKLDHALIINEVDKSLIQFARSSQMKHFIMPTNATAEHLSRMILMYARGIFSESKQVSMFDGETRMKVLKCVVFETDTSSAEST